MLTSNLFFAKNAQVLPARLARSARAPATRARVAVAPKAKVQFVARRKASPPRPSPSTPDTVALAVACLALGLVRAAHPRTTCAVTWRRSRGGRDAKSIFYPIKAPPILTPGPASCSQVTVAKAEKAAGGAAAAAGSLSALAALAGPASAAQARRRAPWPQLAHRLPFALFYWPIAIFLDTMLKKY